MHPNFTAQIVEVEYLDGKKESVRLDRLTVDVFHMWCLAYVDKKAAMLVAYAAGKDIAWVRTLTDDSFCELLKVSTRQNFQRAVAVAEKDPYIASKLMEVMGVLNLGLTMATSVGSEQIDSLLKQQPSAAAEGTPAKSPEA